MDQDGVCLVDIGELVREPGEPLADSRNKHIATSLSVSSNPDVSTVVLPYCLYALPEAAYHLVSF